MAGPGGLDSGVRARVVVVPDTSKFVPSLEKYIKRIEHSLKIEIPTTVDPSGLDEKLAKVRQRQQRNPVTVPLQAQADEFTRQARAAAQKAAKTVQADIPLTADGEALRRDLDRQITALERLTSLTVPLDLGMAAKFRADVLFQVEEIERLAQSAAPQIDLQANVEDVLPKVAAEVARASRVAPAVKIRTEVDRSTASQVSALTTVTGQLATTAARVGANLIQWGPPILVALAGAVAMAPAVAGIVPAVAGAGAAIATLAVGFKGVGTALSLAFDPAQAEEYAKALDKLTPAGRDVVKAIAGLKAPFDRLRDTIQKTLLSGIGPLIERVGPGLLAAVRTGLTPMARGFNDAFKSLGGFLGSASGLKQVRLFLTGAAGATKPLLAALTPLTQALLQIGIAAAPSLRVFSQSILAATQRFAAFTERASKSGQLQKSIAAGFSAVGSVFRTLTSVAVALYQTLAPLGPLAVRVFAGLGSAIVGALGALRSLYPVIAANKVVVAALGIAFLAVVAPVAAAVAAVLATVAVFRAFGPQILAAFAPVIAGVKDFGASLVASFQTVAPAFRGLVAAILPPLISIGRQVIGIVGPALTSIGNIIRTQVAPAFAAFLTAATPVVKFLVEKLGAVLLAVLRTAVGIIRGALTAIAGVINVFAGLLTGDWTRLWQGVKQIVSGAWTAIKAVVSGAASVLKTVLSAAWAAIKAVASRAFSGLVTVVKAAFGRVVSDAKSLAGKVVSGLGNLGSLLYSAGRDMIQGLINGIKSMVGSVVSAAGDLASSAVSAVTSKLKIRSPSRVMIELGRYVAQGFAQGIQADAGKVKTAATSMINKIQDAVKAYRDKRDSLADKIDADQTAVRSAQSRYERTLRDHAKSASTAIRSAGQALKNAQAKYASDLGGGSTAKALEADRRSIDSAKVRYNNAIASQSRSARNAIDAARTGLAKATAKLAKDTGLAKALDLSSGNLSKLTNAQITGLRHYIQLHSRDLTRLAVQREAIASRLAAASTKLQDAIKLRDDYAQSVADSARTFASIITQADEGKALSAGDVVKQLQAKIAAITTFRANLDRLRAAGLSDVALKQLVDAGVEAGAATAQALATGGQEAIQQVNNLTTALGTQADALGEQAARQFYGAGAAAAQGLVAGLQAHEAAIEAEMKRIADAMTKQIKKSLGIKSPSTVMASLGEYIGAGLARGIDSSRVMVQRATDRMAAASIPVGVDFDDGQGAGAGRTLNLNVTNVNPVPETGSLSTSRTLRAAAQFGFA